MEGTEEETRRIYRVLIDFLQTHDLTTSQLLSPGEYVADDVAIRLRDLTTDGILLMRRPYHRWLEKVDNGLDPSNTKILEKALVKIRAGKAGKYGD